MQTLLLPVWSPAAIVPVELGMVEVVVDTLLIPPVTIAPVALQGEDLEETQVTQNYHCGTAGQED